MTRVKHGPKTTTVSQSDTHYDLYQSVAWAPFQFRQPGAAHYTMLLTAATSLLALPSPREEARRRGPHALLPQTRNAAGECPEGCEPVSTVTVRGDPMFKVNGTGTTSGSWRAS